MKTTSSRWMRRFLGPAVAQEIHCYRRVLVVVAALFAVALASTALAPAANAAKLGEVTVTPTYYGQAPKPADAWRVAWSVGWGQAWDACQKSHPSTRSIQLVT